MTNKKPFLILLFLPLLAGSSYIVQDGKQEVGRMVTHDGSSKKEVVSSQELKKDAGGYTHLKASELKATESNKIKMVPDDFPRVSSEVARKNYGIVEGTTELEVDRIASHENMGFPHKTTEYAAGNTYPMRTWVYEYEAGGLNHSYKVYFGTDGKVASVNHQTGK